MALSNFFCLRFCALEMGGCRWGRIQFGVYEDNDFAKSVRSFIGIGGCGRLAHAVREEIHVCMKCCHVGMFVRAMQQYSQFAMMANQAILPTGTSKVESRYEDMRPCTLTTVTPSMDSGRKHFTMVSKATGKNRQVDNDQSFPLHHPVGSVWLGVSTWITERPPAAFSTTLSE